MKTAQEDKKTSFQTSREDSKILPYAIAAFTIVVLILLYLLLRKSPGDSTKITDLPQTGSVKSNLDMEGKRIFNVGDPSEDTDVLTLLFAEDAYVNTTGDTMTGDLIITNDNELAVDGPSNLLVGAISIGSSLSTTESGAYLIGAYDEFENTDSTNVQDVLDDIDQAIVDIESGAFTEADPIFDVSPAGDITTTHISNWNTAYGWGNHASAGYITDGNTNWDNTYGFITDDTSVPKNHLTNSGTLSFDWSDDEVADTITASNYLPLAGGTMVGNITMSDGIWIGNGSGANQPYITFDDSNDYFEFMGGDVGIGTTAPSADLEVAGPDTIFNSSQDGTLGQWSTNSNNLPGEVYGNAVTEGNGYIYSIGGYNNSDIMQTTVAYAEINADGSTNTWQTTTALPATRVYSTAVVANGYIYVIGGWVTTYVPTNTTYYAKINPDGTVGTWQTTSTLPQIRANHSSATANGYIYVLGGADTTTVKSTVYYTKLLPDGTVESWQSTTSLPAPRQYLTSVVANGYLYGIGGVDSGNFSTIVYAKLDTDGTVGSWSTCSNELPLGIHGHTSVASNGHMYVIGGNGDLSSVYYAWINADGSTNTWQTNPNSLPAIRYLSGGAIVNGYVYVIGGYDGSLAKATVLYSSTPRTQILGNLDLLGLTTTSLTDASGDIGSMIYTGGLYSSNSLEVSGWSRLWGEVGIMGTFTGRGEAAFDINSSNTALQLIQQGSGDILNVFHSTDEVFTILNGGDVGIGTTDPAEKLDIEGEIEFDIDTANDTTIGVCKDLADGNSDVEFRECSSTPGDIAEFYAAEAGLRPGDLVSLENINGRSTAVKPTSPYDPNIFSIVSTYPVGQFGKPLGHETVDPNEFPTAMALVGKVPTKVTTSNGNIKIGDPLTSSPIPGVAMKATKPGRIIGYALEDFDASIKVSEKVRNQEELRANSVVKFNLDPLDPQEPDVGKIMVFVNVSWYEPQSYLDTLDQIISDYDKGILQGTGNIDTLSSLTITDSLTANAIQTQDGIFSNIQVGDMSVSQNLDVTGLLTSHQIRTGVLQSFYNENLVIRLSEEIGNTALEIQSSIGETVFSVDSTGDVDIKGEVTVEEKVNVDDRYTNASIGRGVIKAGTTSVIIYTNKVSWDSKIFTSPTTPTGKQELIISSKADDRYFVVSIEEVYHSDISFDWWIIN